MKETPNIQAVTPLENTRLHVVFVNGEERVVDIEPFAAASDWYGELRDPDYFLRVQLVWDGYGIQWPNEQDLSKDTLYLTGKQGSGFAVRIVAATKKVRQALAGLRSKGREAPVRKPEYAE